MASMPTCTSDFASILALFTEALHHSTCPILVMSTSQWLEYSLGQQAQNLELHLGRCENSQSYYLEKRRMHIPAARPHLLQNPSNERGRIVSPDLRWHISPHID